MAKNIGMTLVIMMIVTELILVAAASQSSGEREKFSISPKCIAECGLRCVFEGKNKKSWQWAACLASCAVQCSDTLVDQVCASSCVQSLCSTFLNTGM